MAAKRVGIFVTYDRQGIIDRYVTFILEALLDCVDELIVVHNGMLESDSKCLLFGYSIHLFERLNVGFDAGAVKDVFHKYKCLIKSCDEVIVVNDTFYGPFYPFSEIFSIMDTLDIDFWGLSSHKGGCFNGVSILPHIQSYFLVFKQSVVEDDRLFRFFECLDYPESYNDAVHKYEIGLSQYLYSLGYNSSSYLDIVGSKIVNMYSGVIYSSHSYELLAQARFPIIKRKALSLFNIRDALKSEFYISTHYNYDMDFIKEHLKRQEIISGTLYYNSVRLLDFCRKYQDIYVYGNGHVSKNVVQVFLEHYGIKCKGIVVTHKEYNSDNVMEFSDFTLDDNSGIVIGVGANYIDEVYQMLLRNFSSEQIFRLM